MNSIDQWKVLIPYLLPWFVDDVCYNVRTNSLIQVGCDVSVMMYDKEKSDEWVMFCIYGQTEGLDLTICSVCC